MDQVKERRVTNYKVVCQEHGEIYVQPSEMETLRDYKGFVCPICFQPARWPGYLEIKE